VSQTTTAHVGVIMCCSVFRITSTLRAPPESTPRVLNVTVIAAKCAGSAYYVSLTVDDTLRERRDALHIYATLAARRGKVLFRRLSFMEVAKRVHFIRQMLQEGTQRSRICGGCIQGKLHSFFIQE
jgi:hypothetical protein